MTDITALRNACARAIVQGNTDDDERRFEAKRHLAKALEDTIAFAVAQNPKELDAEQLAHVLVTVLGLMIKHNTQSFDAALFVIGECLGTLVEIQILKGV